MPSPRQLNSQGRIGSHKGRRGRSSISERLATRGCNSAYRSTRLPSSEASSRPETSRGAHCPRKMHTAEPGRARQPSHEDLKSPSPRPRAELSSASETLRIHPFTSERFHVLLNSLFKVLFNFPSRYLSAIGLVPVFSLRWSLPPALGCIPKQPDS